MIDSLGREPQGRAEQKLQKPQRGDRHTVLESAVHAADANLPPLWGYILFCLISWGSRPRLSICRPFGARLEISQHFMFRTVQKNLSLLTKPFSKFTVYTVYEQ
jgi:hypothetical protein